MILPRFLGPVARVLIGSLADPGTRWVREDNIDLYHPPTGWRIPYHAGPLGYKLRFIGEPDAYRFTLVEKLALWPHVRRLARKQRPTTQYRDHAKVLAQLLDQ